MQHERRPATSFAAIVHRWPMVLLVAVPLTLGALLFVGNRTKEYESTAVVSFSPRPAQIVAGDALLLLLPRYPTILKADATLNTVAKQLRVSKHDLATGLTVTIPVSTAVMTITVRLPDRVDATRAANALAATAVKLSRGDRVLSAEVAVSAASATDVSRLRNLLIVLAAAIAGLIFGALVALFVERASPRVRSTADAAELARMPVLGLIPRMRSLSRWRPGERSDRRANAESTTIWMGLLANGVHEETVSCRTILVTSAARARGVSTVATLLAEELARFGLPVLLLDANIAEPSIAERFDVSDQPGLIELVEGTAPLEDTLRASKRSSLTLLPTRQSLGSGDQVVRQFETVLDKLRGEYRAIVVDAPPLFDSEVARVLCSVADRCLLVVRANERAFDVREAGTVLSLVGARSPGIVLNCAGRQFRHER